MSKQKHYIRFLDTLHTFAMKIQKIGPDWMRTIFDDITEKGTKLTMVEIDSRTDRPAIGLCGDLFFCEAGPDIRRKDTIVVFRIESADERHPERIPKEYIADLISISQSENPKDELDDIGNLFKSKTKEPIDRKLTASGQASPELVQVLSLTASSLRRKWLPSVTNDPSLDD